MMSLQSLVESHTKHNRSSAVLDKDAVRVSLGMASSDVDDHVCTRLNAVGWRV